MKRLVTSAILDRLRAVAGWVLFPFALVGLAVIVAAQSAFERD